VSLVALYPNTRFVHVSRLLLLCLPGERLLGCLRTGAQQEWNTDLSVGQLSAVSSAGA
jgi:hypothetical protein